MKPEWIGWLATALFASSYLFKQAVALRKVQAGAALLWVVYGLIIHALPVVVANLAVAGVAGYTLLFGNGRSTGRDRSLTVAVQCKQVPSETEPRR